MSYYGVGGQGLSSANQYLPCYNNPCGYGENYGYSELGYRSVHDGYVPPCCGPYGFPGYYNWWKNWCPL